LVLAHNPTGGPEEMEKESLTSSVIWTEAPRYEIPPMLASKRSPLRNIAKGKLHVRSRYLRWPMQG
ncbi:MAG: hypothetical protein ACREO5_05715, partial [Candidatus Binatia bacterium]